jgi:hypothetical protein
MNDVKWERYGALAGLVFVVLVVIAAFIAGTPPQPTDAPRKIHEFYREVKIHWPSVCRSHGTSTSRWFG